MKELEQKSNVSIILAGIFALIVGVGVARFAFTSLLPPMLDSFLSLSYAGILASFNYVGYLYGAIFAIFIKDINTKVKYFQIGLFICVISTLVLGFTTNEIIWIISRTLGGFGAAMALVVGAALVMVKLNMENKTKAMGIYFSGIGLSIVVTDIIIYITKYFGATWNVIWVILATFGLIASYYSAQVLSVDKRSSTEVIKHKFDKSIFSIFVVLLILAYFTEGVGMVVQATFLPDIINSLIPIENIGNWTWTLVGAAGVPSSILWMRLAHRHGSINITIIAMLLQVIGVLIPAFSSNLYLNLLSGIFYGGTFVGLVALFMNIGGKIAGANPVMLMGTLTTAYGIGQVVAPLYSIVLTNHFGSYSFALYLTAFIVFCGAMFLIFAKKLMNEKEKELLKGTYLA